MSEGETEGGGKQKDAEYLDLKRNTQLLPFRRKINRVSCFLIALNSEMPFYIKSNVISLDLSVS